MDPNTGEIKRLSELSRERLASGEPVEFAADNDARFTVELTDEEAQNLATIPPHERMTELERMRGQAAAAQDLGELSRTVDDTARSTDALTEAVKAGAGTEEEIRAAVTQALNAYGSPMDLANAAQAFMAECERIVEGGRLTGGRRTTAYDIHKGKLLLEIERVRQGARLLQS